MYIFKIPQTLVVFSMYFTYLQSAETENMSLRLIHSCVITQMALFRMTTLLEHSKAQSTDTLQEENWELSNVL